MKKLINASTDPGHNQKCWTIRVLRLEQLRKHYGFDPWSQNIASPESPVSYFVLKNKATLLSPLDDIFKIQRDITE